MSHHYYMQRCLELAKLGAGYVAPNPLVGAVLVHEDKIIGEGWHQQYGGPHAEVNCINSVKEEDKNLISQSVLYVSLEPCVHFGKTPPCTDLIIQHKVPKVVIGCRDPFKEVDGKGIEKLTTANVETEVGIMEKECTELNKRFFTFHTLRRPYVILKWAQTADGKMASPNPSQGGALESSKDKESFTQSGSKVPLSVPTECNEGWERSSRGASRLLIGNEYSNRLVHKWRSEEAAILVGTNTAILDDPELTTRLWSGPSPVRLVVDMDLKLPASLKIFNDASPTIIFNTKVHSKESESATPSPLVERVGVRYYQVTKDSSLVQQMLNALYELKIQSVLVEGGARLLQSFIDECIWDEIRIISNMQLTIGNGLAAPVLSNAIKTEEQILLTDKIEIYKPKDSD